MFQATFRGRELLYPQPFGKVTAGADKDYPVDYSHLNIMGYALGAKGVEPDPDKATFPTVDTETEFGVTDKVKMKVPIFTGALGSTDIARRNWDHFAIGAAISGITVLPSAVSAWCAAKMFAELIRNLSLTATARLKNPRKWIDVSKPIDAIMMYTVTFWFK
jgi:hypothetical protein